MRTPLPGQLEPMTPQGAQLFVDWRYVRAGFVGWYAGDQRIGVWEPAPENTLGVLSAPYGIRLQAQVAATVGPILPRDKPWEYTYHINTVMYDEGVYRSWYECIPDDHFAGKELPWALGHGNVLAYAESDDGFTWRKPALGLLKYAGEATNLVYGRTLSPNGQHGVSVFKDPHAPPAERYKLIYMAALLGLPVGPTRRPGLPLSPAVRQRLREMMSAVLGPEVFETTSGWPASLAGALFGDRHLGAHTPAQIGRLFR